MSNEEKLKKAIDYLRERNKYILDEGNTFVPTPFGDTDITKSIASERVWYADRTLGDTTFRGRADDDGKVK